MLFVRFRRSRTGFSVFRLRCGTHIDYAAVLRHPNSPGLLLVPQGRRTTAAHGAVTSLQNFLKKLFTCIANTCKHFESIHSVTLLQDLAEDIGLETDLRELPIEVSDTPDIPAGVVSTRGTTILRGVGNSVNGSDQQPCSGLRTAGCSGCS